MNFTQTNDFVKIIVNVLQMSNQVAKRTFWVGNETKYDLLKLFLRECTLGKRCFVIVDSVQWVLWPQRETRPGVSAASLIDSLWNMQQNTWQVCGLCNKMQDKSMEYTIRCKTSLWTMQYDARQVCGICNTMQDKSMEYAVRCKTSLWNMQYDARQVCGICYTMQDKSVEYATQCQTGLWNMQYDARQTSPCSSTVSCMSI